LAQLVQNIAVVTPPIASQSRWNYLQLVHVQDFLALMVIVMKGIRLKQQFILLENPTTQDELTQVSNKLNKNFGGLTRHQVAQKEVSLSPFENDVLHEAMLIFQSEDQLGLADPYVGGLRHIFSDNDELKGSQPRELTELFEDRLLLRSILSEIPEKGMVRVAIGGENKANFLHQSSVVFAQYGIPEEASGVLGVVGPTRMEYATAISHVRYLSGIMSELVSETHGL
jgi:heat-inducible transcriptional repressor